jgi:hypothetical protein
MHENIEKVYDKTDYLDVDQPVPGQNYCCISVVSPEHILAKKESFLVKKYLEYLVEENKLAKMIENYDEIVPGYDDFFALKETELEKEFHASVNFATSVRGVKVRGVYDTLSEAEYRAKALQHQDRSHNIFLGQVGYWLPIDVDPNNVKKSEYLEKELNELMKSYNDNELKRDQFYSEQVKNYKNSKSTTQHEHIKKSSVENTIDINNENDIKNMKNMFHSEDPHAANLDEKIGTLDLKEN